MARQRRLQIVELPRQHGFHQFRRDWLFTCVEAGFQCQCQVQLDLQWGAQFGGQHVDRFSRQNRLRLGFGGKAGAEQPLREVADRVQQTDVFYTDTCALI